MAIEVTECLAEMDLQISSIVLRARGAYEVY